MAEKFRCYLVDKDAEGRCTGKVTERSVDDLPPGDVLIKVHYSSLNFKDALWAQGHPGVGASSRMCRALMSPAKWCKALRRHGSRASMCICTGHDQGQNTWGGFSQFARVPASWVVALPDGITLRDSMIYGTAGLTAALCIDALRSPRRDSRARRCCRDRLDRRRRLGRRGDPRQVGLRRHGRDR